MFKQFIVHFAVFIIPQYLLFERLSLLLLLIFFNSLAMTLSLKNLIVLLSKFLYDKVQQNLDTSVFNNGSSLKLKSVFL